MAARSRSIRWRLIKLLGGIPDEVIAAAIARGVLNHAERMGLAYAIFGRRAEDVISQAKVDALLGRR